MQILRHILLPAFVSAVTLLGACSTSAQPAEEAAPEQPAAPVQPEPKADAKVVALLEKIEAASAKLNTLKTRVRYTRLQGLTGDEQRRSRNHRSVAARRR